MSKIGNGAKGEDIKSIWKISQPWKGRNIHSATKRQIKNNKNNI